MQQVQLNKQSSTVDLRCTGLASVALSRVYLRHHVIQKDQIYTWFLVNMQPLRQVLEKVKGTRRTVDAELTHTRTERVGS